MRRATLGLTSSQEGVKRLYGNDYIPDYNELHRQHEARQERELRRYPKCADCGERITGEYLFEIDGKLFCEDCADANFKRSTEDYIG